MKKRRKKLRMRCVPLVCVCVCVYVCCVEYVQWCSWYVGNYQSPYLVQLLLRYGDLGLLGQEVPESSIHPVRKKGLLKYQDGSDFKKD